MEPLCFSSTKKTTDFPPIYPFVSMIVLVIVSREPEIIALVLSVKYSSNVKVLPAFAWKKSDGVELVGVSLLQEERKETRKRRATIFFSIILRRLK
jgi:hypothetical protein